MRWGRILLGQSQTAVHRQDLAHLPRHHCRPRARSMSDGAGLHQLALLATILAEEVQERALVFILPKLGGIANVDAMHQAQIPFLYLVRKVTSRMARIGWCTLACTRRNVIGMLVRRIRLDLPKSNHLK